MKNPYLLLTPGPLSTSESVRSAMLRDWCTWDTEYNSIVQEIRKRLVGLAGVRSDAYTSVLMQGSGTFTVESVIGTVIPKETGKLLVVINGAYGKRMAEIAKMLDIPTIVCAFEEHETINMEQVMILLEEHQDITHVAMVHCETTTGILNPIKEFCDVAKRYNKVTIIDAMSSFGGMPIMIEDLQIDFLISSANKCIQGVPGFGFVIANRKKLEECQGNARSLSLDLYSQYKTMEEHGGKWRFTSPTHVVRAFYQALIELEEEGGIMARHQRYVENQWILVEGMVKLGFKPFLHKGIQSPIITSFYYPKVSDFQFEQFYGSIKEKGFVIYPGKISQVDTFRIGNIGEVYPKDIHRLLEAIETTIALETKGVR